MFESPHLQGAPVDSMFRRQGEVTAVLQIRLGKALVTRLGLFHGHTKLCRSSLGAMGGRCHFAAESYRTPQWWVLKILELSGSFPGRVQLPQPKASRPLVTLRGVWSWFLLSIHSYFTVKIWGWKEERKEGQKTNINIFKSKPVVRILEFSGPSKTISLSPGLHQVAKYFVYEKCFLMIMILFFHSWPICPFWL